MQSINAQFAHPRGLLGYLAGMIMAYENRERIAWAVAQLNPQPADHILEIGFGAGVAIQLLSRVVRSGSVAGIDSSAAMVQLASRQNREEIRNGKVSLHQGPAEALPYQDSSFDKAIAINSFHIWADQSAGLSELWRVMKPGGMIAITEQPISSISSEAGKAIAEKLTGQIRRAGFHDLHTEFKPMRPAPTMCVMGTK